jgi:methyl-accepting chemotaxis protein
MGGCTDKINRRCKVIYGACVDYQLEVPEFSNLVGEGCINIEQVANDIYEIIGGIITDSSLTETDMGCLTNPSSRTVKVVIQALIDKICEQQETITEITGQIATIEEQITNIQEQNCP